MHIVLIIQKTAGEITICGKTKEEESKKKTDCKKAPFLLIYQCLNLIAKPNSKLIYFYYKIVVLNNN